MKIIDKIKRWLGMGMYILTDPEDGSITLSRLLYEQMQEDCDQKLDDVFGFALEDGHYGWQCNPKDDPFLKEIESLPVAKVQYNGQHKSIGFMLTNPTLAKVYYDYALPDERLKLKVTRQILPGRTIYYRIER